MLAALSIFLTAQAPAQAEWSPSKPIEFVVMASPTGSSSKTVQVISSIIQKHALAPISFQVVHKEGNSGADGVRHVTKATDPDHTLLISGTAYFAMAARHRDLGAEISLFTPIAGMGLDVLMFWVAAARQDITDLPSLTQAIHDKNQTTGQDWVVAGFGRESTGALLTEYFAITQQAKLKFQPCASGGDAANLLLENKADIVLSTPANLEEDYHQTKKIKPILAFAKNLAEPYADIPRYSEAENKFSIEIPRMIVGSKGMSLEAQAYYVSLLNKVFKTPEWGSYMRENALQGKFLTGPALVDKTLEQMNAHKIMAEVVGVFGTMRAPNGAAASTPSQAPAAAAAQKPHEPAKGEPAKGATPTKKISVH
jgi:putative tricarboxylic transport membrane protein